MALFTKEYFPLLIFLSWLTLLRQHGFCSLSIMAFHAHSPVYALKRAHMWAFFQCCAKVSQLKSFLWCANLVLCTWSIAFNCPSLQGSQQSYPILCNVMLCYVMLCYSFSVCRGNPWTSWHSIILFIEKFWEKFWTHLICISSVSRCPLLSCVAHLKDRFCGLHFPNILLNDLGNWTNHSVSLFCTQYQSSLRY
jgi:hypothetical protein